MHTTQESVSERATDAKTEAQAAGEACRDCGCDKGEAATGGYNFATGRVDMATVPKTSRLPATCGRDLLAYSHSQWVGPRPAKVMVGPHAPIDDVRGGAFQRVDANIHFHGSRDQGMLAQVRASPQGNTFTSLPVFDPLNDAERQAVIASGIGLWLEWPSRV